MIGQLAFEATFRKVSIGEFIGELIVAVVKQDLLQLTRVREVFALRTLDCEPRLDLPVLLPKTFAHPPVEVTGTCY